MLAQSTTSSGRRARNAVLLAGAGFGAFSTLSLDKAFVPSVVVQDSAVVGNQAPTKCTSDARAGTGAASWTQAAAGVAAFGISVAAAGSFKSSGHRRALVAGARKNRAEGSEAHAASIIQRPDAVGAEFASLSRRSSVLALFGGAAVAATFPAEKPAVARLQSSSSDAGSADFSKLDGLLSKSFGAAQEKTKCKPRAEGEQRSFCILQEINEKNRAEAEARGEKYVDKKATLSKGSYGT